MKRPSFNDTKPAIRRTMRANRGKDTKPEMIVRRMVHGLGYRYRLHRKELPGKPDIALGPRKAIIEVRGCFWHRHPGCPLAYMPKTRIDFWRAKFDTNVARDARNTDTLQDAGWRVLTVWECETSSATVLADRVRAFLESEPNSAET